MLAAEDFLVAVDGAGTAVHVRNKRLAEPVGGRRPAVVFVHGATYPIATTFDLPLDGFSWMDAIATAGWDVYGVDMRGYGASTRDPAMERPPSENAPLTMTDVAVEDLAKVVRFLRERRGVEWLALLGTSWGSSVVGAYATRGDKSVFALVQHAPQWLRDGPSGGDPGGDLGAYRTVSVGRALDRWLGAIPPEKLDACVPSAWRERFMRALLDADPAARTAQPPGVRAPNGALMLTREYWRTGRPFYDPAKIVVPVLVIHGDWDRDIPTPIQLAYFSRLENARRRRFIEIGEATHMVMLERSRTQLFAEVQLFLNEAAKERA